MQQLVKALQGTLVTLGKTVDGILRRENEMNTRIKALESRVEELSLGQIDNDSDGDSGHRRNTPHY